MAGANPGTGGRGASPLTCDLLDADGDGATVYPAGCILITDPSRPSTEDCNDADEAVSVAAFIDADGDGAGDRLRPACLPAGPLPAGYAGAGIDCDDASASIHPSMLEVAGDGVDQNCDGSDGFIACGGPSLCACEEGGTVAVDAPCDGFDLAVNQFDVCLSGGCGQMQTYFIKVVNLGTKDAPGEISVFGDGNGVRLVGLSAGHVTPRIEWPGPAPSSIRVSVTNPSADEAAPGDCNPENDVFELTSSGVSPLCR
jgi:hypothetical protein